MTTIDITMIYLIMMLATIAIIKPTDTLHWMAVIIWPMTIILIIVVMILHFLIGDDLG